MEQKQFDYGVELCDPESIFSSTKEQLFETLETVMKLKCSATLPQLHYVDKYLVFCYSQEVNWVKIKLP